MAQGTKRFLALLLALMLCVSLLPTAALAEDEGTIAPVGAVAPDGPSDDAEPTEDPGTIAPAPEPGDEPQEIYSGECGDNLTWSFDTDTHALTITGTGDMWDFTVETVPWADYRSQIVSVEIPEGVTGIGDYAFTQCAFSSVTIPDSVTRIGGGAFANCLRLESVTIPAGVTSIGKQAFYNCLWLSAFFVDEASASYSAADGILFNKDGTTLIVAPIAHEYSHYAIPAGVERIEDFAFANCGDLYNLELPVSLTEIGHAAFMNCSELTSVCFPQSLSAIGDLAFWHCAAMTEIRFLGHAPTFGTQPFRNVGANAYYPAADETWTEDVRQQYGGTLTWVADYSQVSNPFVDVQAGQYYFLPVLWAYYHSPKITGGTDASHFSPDATCTREQIVTFLWKANGAPEPKTTDNPFTDVKASDYYYKAVLWAVENKVTKGVDATHFGVGAPCTREQAMTFLWKANGAPEPTTTDNPFTDVKTGDYYCKAVLWAVENKITKGVDATHFGVGRPCTRAQIVTFLYAAEGKPWG